MTKTVCNLVTPAVEELAKQFGRSSALTNVIISAWQTDNQTMNYPTIDQLRDYYKNRHRERDLSAMRIRQSDEYTALSRDFTPLVLQDRINSLARDFSRIVGESLEERIAGIQRELKGEYSKENRNQDKILELQGKLLEYQGPTGRQAVIRDLTLKKIFDKIRAEYEELCDMSAAELDEYYGKGRGEYMLTEYQKIINNFPALLVEACQVLENIEHFRVNVDYCTYNDGNNTYDVLGGTIEATSDDEQNDEDQFSDDEDGSRATGNDGWSFQVRFVDPYSTLSKEVKEILSNIIRVTADGNEDVDDLGNVRYLNPEYTHVTLLNIMSKIVDPDDFSVKDGDNYKFPVLEQASAKYPWMQQIINVLRNNPKLVGSFYADLRKDFIHYWHQFHDSEAKLVTHRLNENTALESSLNSAENNYLERQLLDENSLYDTSGKIVTKNAKIGEELVTNTTQLTRDFDEDNLEDIAKNSAKVFRMLGFNIQAGAIHNLIQSPDGIHELETALNFASNIFQDVQKDNLDSESNLIELYKDYYKDIAEKIGVVEELDNIASFRQGSKTRYSYSAPNYIDTMIKLFKDNNRRDQYLEDEFGRFEWFKKDGRWRAGWLEIIANDENARFQLETKEVIDIDGADYTQWNPIQIKKAFVNEYFSQGINPGSQQQYAWYNMPIFSDSPVVKFIRFVRYTDNYEEILLDKLADVVKQEIYRIDLCRERRLNKVPPIQNIDKINPETDKSFGEQFHFFPELNNPELQFLEKANAFIEAKDTKGLNGLIKDNLRVIMNGLFDDFYQENVGLHADNLLKLGVIQTKEQERDALREYFWNQAYATTQIIELTTTDLAFYKDDVDFQKRFKEVYASGTKLNTNAQYGKKTRRAIYLRDNEITSTTYYDIKEVLNEACKQGRIKNFDRDNILIKFKEVNVADAQAYITPQTLRSVLSMMGAWTDDMENALNRFEAGEWDMSDFNILWQTIKPFVYTQIAKPTGLNDGKMIKVPHQNKNSEYILLAAYQMIAASTKKSSQLRAIHNFMRKNDIDVIEFQSAVKAGGQGPIDISYYRPKLVRSYRKYIDPKATNEEITINAFKKALDKKLDEGSMAQKEYNEAFKSIKPDEEETYKILENNAKPNGQFDPTVVHELPYRDYMIQQPTPEHLIDAHGVFGSQLRNLIMADLPDDFKTTIHGKELNKQDTITLYNSLIVENLLEDYAQLSGRFQNIYSLQRALLGQVRGNTKFSRDMINALQIVEIVNPITGEKEKVFNMPLNNPSATLKLQELINSMFKNAIAKQKIKGGNAILVSNFGLTYELNLVYEGTGANKRITGIECYLPASSRKFYEPFMKTSADGKYQYLDVKNLPIELRKLVGYRIPTEDKYSMAPLIVKGFLPQQNGSAIMLPADITQIAGSDFDVDKMFLMIPEFREEEYDIQKAIEDFKAINSDDAVTNLISSIFADNENLESALEEDPTDFKEWWKEHKEEYKLAKPRVVKFRYNMNKDPKDNKRAQRNNMLIDIIYNILTHPSMTSNVLSPGNFDTVKLQARIARIISDPYMLKQFRANFTSKYDLSTNEGVINELLECSRTGNLSKLDDFVQKYRKPKSQLTLNTFIYNHVQNMTGGTLIGMYANNTTSQAKYQHSNLALADDFTFFINGRKIQSLHDAFSPLGERISKNCAEFSAASVDNVKDPVLADLLQDKNTAKITAFMLRAGMSIEEIALIFDQPVIKMAMAVHDGLSDMSKTIDTLKNQLYRVKGGVDFNFREHNFTSRELLENALSRETLDEILENTGEHETAENKRLLGQQLQVALLIRHIAQLADELVDISDISRADSPNGAILNNLAGAKVQVARVSRIMQKTKEKKYPFTGVTEAIQNDLVSENQSIDELRETIMRRKMPMLQAFYSLGIELGTKLIGRYFQQINPYSDEMLQFIFDNASPDFLGKRNINGATRVVYNFYKDLVTFALSSTKLFGDEITTNESVQQNNNEGQTLNIYAGTNENADLSNFAIRPFVYTYKNGNTQAFQSVEQAFQYLKVTSYSSNKEAADSIGKQILETTDGGSLRSLGKRREIGLDVSRWDEASSRLMKKLIKLSFEQNPSARQRLINTGNAKLTHTQDKSKWGEEFPRILADVRSEFQQENDRKLEIKAIKDVGKKDEVKASIANKFIGFAEGVKDSSTASYAQQAGNKANTGSYNSNDTVFVSILGKNRNVDEDRRHQLQDRTIEEALQALYSGATLVTDNAEYVSKSDYNEGEKRLAEALKEKGAHYTEKTINGYKVGMWSMSTTTFQPQTFEEKRDYYLREYPLKFLEEKTKNPDIAKLGLMHKLTVDTDFITGNNKIVFKRSGRLRQQARDAYMRDMDALLSMGDAGRQMAYDLFMYSYYSDAFWFGPNSFGNFFSTNFYNTFPEVNEVLRSMKFMERGSFYDRFLPMFYANNTKDSYYVVPIVFNTENDEHPIELGKDGMLFVPTNKSFNRTTNVGDYQYLKFEDKLYRLSSRGDRGGRSTYREVPMLNEVKYNANKTVEELKEFDSEQATSSEFDFFGAPDEFFDGLSEQDMLELDNAKPVQSGNNNTSIATSTQQTSSNNIDFDSLDMSDVDDEFATLENGYTDDWGAGLTALENGDFSESEGEQTLTKPMCKENTVNKQK